MRQLQEERRACFFTSIIFSQCVSDLCIFSQGKLLAREPADSAVLYRVCFSSKKILVTLILIEQLIGY